MNKLIIVITSLTHWFKSSIRFDLLKALFMTYFEETLSPLWCIPWRAISLRFHEYLLVVSAVLACLFAFSKCDCVPSEVPTNALIWKEFQGPGSIGIERNNPRKRGREQAGINLGDNENAGYTTNHPARNSLSLPQGRPIPSACIHVIKIKRALALSRDVKRANYKTPPPLKRIARAYILIYIA
jgi:hypothetical protein